MVDVILLCIASLVPPLPFVIFLSSLYFCFDPYYFIIGDIIGDPNYERVSSTTNYICFGLRAFLTLCSFECARTVILGSMVMGTCVDVIQNHFQSMLNRQVDNCITVMYSLIQYKRLIIICINVRLLLQEGTTLCITGAFWGRGYSIMGGDQSIQGSTTFYVLNGALCVAYCFSCFNCVLKGSVEILYTVIISYVASSTAHEMASHEG